MSGLRWILVERAVTDILLAVGIVRSAATMGGLFSGEIGC